MRNEFINFISEKMAMDDSVVLLVADTGRDIYHIIKKKFHDRCFNLGICEQSFIGIAVGMALIGLKPYTYTITPFLIERPFEQIKMDVVANKANVKLISYWDYFTDGVSHYTEDISGICKILKLKCEIPNDSIEAKTILEKEYLLTEPCFIHLTKDNKI